MAVDYVQLFGLLLMAAGAIALVLVGLKATGKYKRMNVGLVAAGVLVVGFFLGGVQGFTSLAIQAPPVTPGPTALWDARITAATHSDAGVTVIVASDGQRADFYGSEADLGDNAPGDASITATITLVNLNQGDSTVTWQGVMTYGSYDTILDPATGANYPLVDPLATDPSIADITWVDGSTDGAQAGKLFYDSVATSATETEVATVDLNDAAIAPMTVGLQYTINLVAVGVTFPLGIHPTS